MLDKIRSLRILNIIFRNIRKGSKLKILKYNKKIQNKLNIDKKDFKDFKLLKELNQKFNLDIKDTEVTRLNLSCKNIGKNSELMKYLKEIDFNYLSEIQLSFNEISDIKNLCKFDKLKILRLDNNDKGNIDILKKKNLTGLKHLYLNYNKISNINVLGKVEFEKLEYLDLSNNIIDNIKVLEKANFKELKSLNLCWNNIQDIKVLENVKFEKLEFLDLSNNKIENINVLDKANFRN